MKNKSKVKKSAVKKKVIVKKPLVNKNKKAPISSVVKTKRKSLTKQTKLEVIPPVPVEETKLPETSFSNSVYEKASTDEISEDNIPQHNLPALEFDQEEEENDSVSIPFVLSIVVIILLFLGSILYIGTHKKATTNSIPAPIHDVVAPTNTVSYNLDNIAPTVPDLKKKLIEPTKVVVTNIPTVTSPIVHHHHHHSQVNYTETNNVDAPWSFKSYP